MRRGLGAVLWICATLALLDASGYPATAPVPLGQSDAAVWQPPLSAALADRNVNVTSLAVVAVAAGFLVVTTSPLSAAPLPWTLIVLGNAASGLGAVEQAVVVAMAWRIATDCRTWRQALALGFAWMIVAATFSIEFGLVPIALAAALITKEQDDPQRSFPARFGRVTPVLATVALFAVIFAFATFAVPQTVQTLLRPLSWMQAGLSDAFPATGPLWSERVGFPKFLLLTATALCWPRCWKAADGRGRLLLIAAFLTALGLCSGYYLPTAAVLIALSANQATLFWSAETLPGFRRQLRRFAIAALCIGIAADAVYWRWETLLIPSRLSPVLAPETWNVSGSVLLLDLQDSPFWRRPGREDFTLIADDRWETGRTDFLEYAAICRDLADFRPESYVRSDGKTGGYAQTMLQWNPALVVAPADRADLVRRLSLNPQCRLVGMDGRRAYFAWTERRDSAPLIARSGRELRALEWPGPAAEERKHFRFLDHRTSAVGAEAMRAVRLPYASLHLDFHSRDPWARWRRGMAYLEIAHREQRHAEHASLLNLLRGTAIVESGYRWSPWTIGKRDRSTAALAALRHDDVMSQEVADVRERSRRFLVAGDLKAALKSLQDDSGPTSPYSRLLLESVSASARQVAADLLALLQSNPDWTAEVVSQAWYDLGCLGLEIGDARLAIEAFQRSAAQDPQAPFRHIRDLHIRMLRAARN